jgi:hypothetical protein
VSVDDLNQQIRDNMLVLHDDLRSMLPEPVEVVVGASTSVALPANNTTAHLGVIGVTRPVIIKSIQYNISAAGGGATSTIRIALYTEDGQTKLIDVVDACGANVGVRTVDVNPDLAIEAGNYIVLICHGVYNTSAKAVTRYAYDTTLQAHVAAEPDLSGTLTIAGGAAPATIDPTAFTTVAGALIPVVRFLGTA